MSLGISNNEGLVIPLPVKVAVFKTDGFIRSDVIPVQPVRLSEVHVVGKAGSDVSVVFPERFSAVTLVPDRVKLVSPVGNVGNVVSDVQPDRFRDIVVLGNPPIVVSPALIIDSAAGSPVQPVRLSEVHVEGKAGSDVSRLHPKAFNCVKTDPAAMVKFVHFLGTSEYVTCDGIWKADG